MLKRLSLIALGTAIALSACTQTPNAPTATHPASNAYGIQQQTDSEGANDASLDAIIRELDAEAGNDQTATQSAVPMQSQNVWRFRTQQAGRDRDRGYGWYGGYGYGPYGYGIFARCQRIYRRCLNRAFYYYSGSNTYQFCRRVRNRCINAQWMRY